MRTLYTILEANPSDSSSELKKAYYRAARKLHPDKNADDFNFGESSSSVAGDATSFIELNKAWTILSSDESRRDYDFWLREQLLREETSILFENVMEDDILEQW